MLFSECLCLQPEVGTRASQSLVNLGGSGRFGSDGEERLRTVSAHSAMVNDCRSRGFSVNR